MIASVGYAVGYLANATGWDAVLQKRIFDPLQMTSSYTTFAAAQVRFIRFCLQCFCLPCAPAGLITELTCC